MVGAASSADDAYSSRDRGLVSSFHWVSLTIQELQQTTSYIFCNHLAQTNPK